MLNVAKKKENKITNTRVRMSREHTETRRATCRNRDRLNFLTRANEIVRLRAIGVKCKCVIVGVMCVHTAFVSPLAKGYSQFGNKAKIWP